MMHDRTAAKETLSGLSVADAMFISWILSARQLTGPRAPDNFKVGVTA